MKSIFIDILINRTGFDRFERLIVTGGASVNHSILQIIADIFQTPVYTINVKDSASIGAGIRASIGYLKQTKPDLSIEDFFNSISPNDILNLMNEPNKDVKNIYDNLLDVYSKIESSLLQKTTTAGFEPARAMPSRFLVCLLNHSDKLSWRSCFKVPI